VAATRIGEKKIAFIFGAKPGNEAAKPIFDADSYFSSFSNNFYQRGGACLSLERVMAQRIPATLSSRLLTSSFFQIWTKIKFEEATGLIIGAKSYFSLYDRNQEAH
jgi:hypothetical protein